MPGTLIALVRRTERVSQDQKPAWVCNACYNAIATAHAEVEGPEWPKSWEISALGRASFDGFCRRVPAHRIKQGEAVGLVWKEKKRIWVCATCVNAAPAEKIIPLRKALEDAGVEVGEPESETPRRDVANTWEELMGEDPPVDPGSSSD